jgi:hypothetical protein
VFSGDSLAVGVAAAALHRIGLRHPQFAQATCGTIRLKLRKIGAPVAIGVRRRPISSR